MSKLYGTIFILCTLSLVASDKKQYEFSNRGPYIQGLRNNPPGWCAFCDEENLKKNDIIQKDQKSNVMIMMNQNPYACLDQSHHLMITSLSHHENLTCFSLQELKQQVDAAHEVSKKLHQESFSQECFVNMGGKPSGGSVPHSHIHIKSFIQAPCLVHEAAWNQKFFSHLTKESACVLVTSKLAEPLPLAVCVDPSYSHTKCHDCQVKNDFSQHIFVNGNQCSADEYNFVIGKFKHNMIYISHDPKIAGEVVVMPYKHVPAIKDLSSEEIRENMALATALVPQLLEYAKKIREGEVGCNIYTKSICNKASIKKQQRYHLVTRVMPRTVIYATSGTLEGNSCKIDCNLFDLFAYLKEYSPVLQAVSDNCNS